MKINQTNLFKKAVKKLPKQTKIAIDNEIKKIAENPMLGDLKEL